MYLQKSQNLHFLIRKFINHLMVDGKKNKAEKLFFQSLIILKKKEKEKPLLIFLQALQNSLPIVEIRSVRRGGATYQIPLPLQEKRALSLAMKWIISDARKKSGPFSMRLTSVFLDSSKNQGDSVKKRESLHAVALKNRSLTHFRWF